ncbi:MAG: methyl-accepting chemotaxis protein [Firmicutes bacterium]|nr:methyl-accepting chemotaxis protein [[Eubacterium] siraeum]MCM1487192.1 methyl-accepting chemotaxis protein [Bacillota bacterium]
MAENEKKLSSSRATETTVKIHISVVVGVCIAFGLINVISGTVTLGIIIAVLGAAVGGLMVLLKNSTSIILRGTVMSQVQILIIIIMSAVKHEMHGMFPLMLASLTIAAVYYSKQNIIIHWVIMDAAAVLGLILRDFFYGSAELEFLLKGIVGINVGAALVFYLIKCSIRYIGEAEKSKSEADQLVVKVHEQVEESEKLINQQHSVVEQIALISEAVNSSSEKMLQVSDKINDAASEQKQSIQNVSSSIDEIAKETENSRSESEEAAEVALKSTELVNTSNAEMQNMIAAMSEITESSKKIETIIKTIEDIAFQTNILALNAAVEAARAGEAGKGFAVVAGEVRNLATKSAETVKGTSALIQASINSVDRGCELANRAAEKMSGVMESAEESARHAKKMAELSERQAASIEHVRSQMETISDVVARTLETAEESSEIAHEVSENAGKMDEIVKTNKLQ